MYLYLGDINAQRNLNQPYKSVALDQALKVTHTV